MLDFLCRSVGGYFLTDFLGEGASSFVFRGVKGGDVYAVKVLKDDVSPDLFFTEASRQKSFFHPNVVRVKDVVTNPTAIVMEFMEGGSLADRIKQHGSFKPSVAVDIAQDVIHGLVAIHGAGFVHRDIKPANILFNGSGVAKIADLGALASVSGTRSSKDADIAGTLFYRAPELRFGVVDVRSDVFSVGRVLYEMLTGTLPSQTGTNHPAELVDVDYSLDMFVARALELDPVVRFQSASEMLIAINSFEVLDSLRGPSVPSPSVVNHSVTVNSTPPTTNIGDPWIDPEKVKKVEPKQYVSPAAISAALFLISIPFISLSCHILSSFPSSSKSPSAPVKVSPSVVEKTGYVGYSSKSDVVFGGTQKSINSDSYPVNSVDKLSDCSELYGLFSGNVDCRGQDVLMCDGSKYVLGTGIILSNKGYLLSCCDSDSAIFGDLELELSCVGRSSNDLFLYRISKSSDADRILSSMKIVCVSEDYSSLTAKARTLYSWKDVAVGWSVRSDITGRVVRDVVGDLSDVLPGAVVYNSSGALCGLLQKRFVGKNKYDFEFIPAPKLVAFIDALRK